MAAADMRRRIVRFWPWLAGIALLLAGMYLFLPGLTQGDQVPFLTAAIERGAVATSIAATGTLQAVLTVQVGSQVTGRIQSLHADFNSIVKEGQIIARIDPATFDAALVRSRADLEDARAGVTTARADLLNQNANLEAVRAAALDAERVFERNKELSDEGISSTRDLEAAEAARNETAGRLKQAAAQVESSTAAIAQAQARVKQAEAQVRLAEVNLNYTVITSPTDGVVVSRNVDVGQTVAASLSAPTLFVIAHDLTHMQVVANVDEADIGHIGPESDVTFTVDSFPGEGFQGVIDQFRLNPVVTQNVVTYSVIVNVDNPELKLRPGMTANATFTVAEAGDALRLPNAALRFWPADVPRSRERELIEQAKHDAGAGPEATPAAGSPDEGRRAAPEAAAADAQPAGDRRARAPKADGAPQGERSAQAGANGATSPISSVEGVLRFPRIHRARWKPRVVWVTGAAGKPEPRVVRVGITDGSVSELQEGVLAEGDMVITGATTMAAQEGRPNNPFNPMGPRGAPPRRPSSGR